MRAQGSNLLVAFFVGVGHLAAQEEEPLTLPGPGLDIPVDVDGDGESTFGDVHFFNWWLEKGGSLEKALAAAEVAGGGEVNRPFQVLRRP